MTGDADGDSGPQMHVPPRTSRTPIGGVVRWCVWWGRGPSGTILEKNYCAISQIYDFVCGETHWSIRVSLLQPADRAIRSDHTSSEVCYGREEEGKEGNEEEGRTEAEGNQEEGCQEEVVRCRILQLIAGSAKGPASCRPCAFPPMMFFRLWARERAPAGVVGSRRPLLPTPYSLLTPYRVARCAAAEEVRPCCPVSAGAHSRRACPSLPRRASVIGRRSHRE